jgi:hypothetical protein
MGFLGRKVYPSLIVVLVSAMNNGLSPQRIAEVRKTLAVSRATLNQWRKWWLNQFIQTRFWKAARARFMPIISESAMPSSERKVGRRKLKKTSMSNFPWSGPLQN